MHFLKLCEVTDTCSFFLDWKRFQSVFGNQATEICIYKSENSFCESLKRTSFPTSLKLRSLKKKKLFQFFIVIFSMGRYNKPPTFLKRSFRHWLYTILSFVLTMEAMSELDLLHQMGDSFSFLSSPPFISTATGWSSKCPACKYFSKWASILPASWLKSCLRQFALKLIWMRGKWRMSPSPSRLSK